MELCGSSSRCSGVWSVSVDGHFVENVLRDGESLDTESFEVDVAISDASSQPIPSLALDPVHDGGR
jgi:hypothetical protein